MGGIAERADKDQLERVINHAVQERFAAGAVQRAVLLEHGEDPPVGPEQLMVRVFVPAPDDPRGARRTVALTRPGRIWACSTGAIHSALVRRKRYGDPGSPVSRNHPSRVRRLGLPVPDDLG